MVSNRIRFDLVGPVPPSSFIGNGCTNGPDGLNNVDWSEACRWHDWAYHLGGNEINRLNADRALISNLLTLGCPVSICDIFFNRVRLWGVSYFNYHDPKNRPRLIGWLWLIIARYWQ